MSDTRAFLDYLAGQPDVKPGGVGTTGYCVGGLIALRGNRSGRARSQAAPDD
ncbi:MAG TPA: dienelactone hydrolase family protein [Polyangiaceae bacterium]|jgi:carboxymethylenebutenolidase